jgi:heme exporter protein D
VNFDSISDFLAMGGHGLYVWLAYGSAVIVVIANVVSVRFARRRFFRQARALERRREAEPRGSDANQMPG